MKLMPKALGRLNPLIWLGVFVVSGCSPMTGNYASHISADRLKDKGFLVGRLTLEDLKHGTSLGGIWTMNVNPVFDRQGSKWTGASAMVTNSENGYFAIPVKPDTYTLRRFEFSPGFTRPLTTSMSVCCYDGFNQISVGAGEVVYIGHLKLQIHAKPKKQQLQEALKTGPLAPVLVPGALLSDEEYLTVDIVDDYEADTAFFTAKNALPKESMVKKLLLDK